MSQQRQQSLLYTAQARPAGQQAGYPPAAASPSLTAESLPSLLCFAPCRYVGAPQWDPEYMGGSMMVPVPFVLWGLGLAFFMFCLLLGIKGITGGWVGGWGCGGVGMLLALLGLGEGLGRGWDACHDVASSAALTPTPGAGA